MTDVVVIKINNTKAFELEFEVIVQGLSTDSPDTQVRFVITNVLGGCLYFNCMKESDTGMTWMVKLPILLLLSPEINAHMFRVEVIVDGYYFEPAQGQLFLIKDPGIALTKQIEKTEIDVSSVSFTVKEQPKKIEIANATEIEIATEKDTTNERAPGGGNDVTGQVAPTNNLLVPEYDPNDGSEKKSNIKYNRPEDQEINLDDLLDPKNINKAKVNTGGDPDALAEKIVKEVVIKPKRGFLFSKTKDGTPVVEGLFDPRIEKQKSDRSAKVKKILTGN